MSDFYEKEVEKSRWILEGIKREKFNTQEKLKRLIDEIRKLSNRDDEIMPKGTYTLKKGLLDGGGVGKFEVIKLIKKYFEEKDLEEKNE